MMPKCASTVMTFTQYQKIENNITKLEIKFLKILVYYMKVIAFIVLLLVVLWFFRNVQEGADNAELDKIKSQIDRLQELRDDMEPEQRKSKSLEQLKKIRPAYEDDIKEIIKDHRNNTLDNRKVTGDMNINDALINLKNKKESL